MYTSSQPIRDLERRLECILNQLHALVSVVNTFGIEDIAK